MFVLVTICLGGRFGINCSNASWKFWNFQNKTRAISKLLEITSVIYSQNCPNLACDYWLIAPNQQTFLLKLISFNSGQLQIRGGQIQNSGNYKTTPLSMQHRLQSTVWLVALIVT